MFNKQNKHECKIFATKTVVNLIDFKQVVI